MPKFEGVQLTKHGHELFSTGITDGKPTVITRLAIGDGFIPDGETYDRLNALVSEVYSPSLIGKGILAADLAELRFDYTSAITNEGFWFREIGIFAEGLEGNEVLYAAENLGKYAEYIPPLESATFVKRVVSLLVKISNAANVTINVTNTREIKLEYVVDRFESIEGQQVFELMKTNSGGALSVIVDGTETLDFLAENGTVSIPYPLTGGTAVWVKEIKQAF